LGEPARAAAAPGAAGRARRGRARGGAGSRPQRGAGGRGGPGALPRQKNPGIARWLLRWRRRTITLAARAA